MSVEHTTARLISLAIRQRLEARQVHFGLLARNLPPFDPQTLYGLFAKDLVMPTPLLRLALIGYTLVGSFDRTCVTTDVEQAVAWRNDPEISSPLVVLVNPQHMAEKIHSLELLDPFEDEDLRRAIAVEGQRSDDPQRQLVWKVLNSSEFRRTLPLVAEQLASYYAAVEAGSSLGDALPWLGLLRDSELPQTAHERSALLRRIKLNHELVQKLLVLDKKDYRALGRALGSGQAEHQKTFLAIQKYTQQPSFETLNQEIFTFAAVQALFRDKVPEPVVETPTNTPTSIQLTSAPPLPRSAGDLLFDWILSHDKEQRDTLAEFAHEENETYREDPTNDQEIDQTDGDMPPLRFFVNGQEGTLPRLTDETRHPLETVMRQWAQNEIWGGIIDARHGVDATLPFPRLFDGTTVLPKLHPFYPLQDGPVGLDGQLSLFNLLAALDRVLKLPVDAQLAPMLQTLRNIRAELTPYRIRFLYQPVRATFDPLMFNRIASYIDIYERLADRLQEIYRQALEQYPDTIEQATAQFLALDSVIIVRTNDTSSRRGGEAALLTTMHPLHLWKWLELARRIQADTTDFSPAERAFMQDKIAQLPTLLNTFLLHPGMFPPKLFAAPHHLEEPRLVLVGEIRNERTEETVGVPYYQPIAQYRAPFVALDTKHLRELLEDFLALYPPARIGLSLVIIDPPILKPFLEACSGLADDRLLHGARILVYQTDPQAQAYDARSLEDSEAMSRFRNSSRWMLNVDLDHTSYAEISTSLAEHGPYHIITLFDPSEAVVQPIMRSSQDQSNPFGVPIHVSYDSIRDTVRRVPAPTGGIFDVYTGVRNALSGELSRRTLGVGNRPAITDNSLQALTQSSYWLVVLDRPSGTLELPVVGQKLAWQPTGDRTLVVYTRDQERWQAHLSEHLSQLTVPLDPALVNQYLREILTIFPNGLLDTLAAPSAVETEVMHQAFRQNSLQKLLGIVTTLYDYRRDHSATMLVSFDTDELKAAFGWSVEPSLASAAYLLAMWPEKDQIHLDIIAVQTYDTTLGRLPALSESKPLLKQLEVFARTLEQLFKPGADSTLLDPMRRELIREYLSVAVFAPSIHELTDQQRDERIEIKSNWANVINDIFSAYSPLIRLRSIRVALQGSGRAYVQSLGAEPYTTEVVSLPSTILLTEPQSQPTTSISSSSSNKASESTLSAEASSVIDKIEQIEPVVEKSEYTEPSQLVLPEHYVSEILSAQHPPALEIIQEDISDQAQRLLRVLIDYGIAVASIDVEKTQIGPRVIRYWIKLQPPAGRLAEVQKYAVDLARELGSKSIPLIDNIPGERYIGIDLAREQPQIMPLMPALATLPEHQSDSLLITMGVNAAGQHIQEDLVKMPHMLVAGTTGSGKTMFLTSLITSLALKHTPADLQMLLVDPKQTDFVIFDRLNHLRDNKVYYDPTEAIETLRLIIGPDLEERTARLSQARCPNNLEYNRRNPTQRIPWLVIVIDEFADIMLTLPRSERETFERQIGRLAAIGRAKGIHLVLATQRPTTDIITGTLKANIPARISFRLPSLTDSRTILDRGGAEHLLGQGDMLALINNEIQRLQGYYASYDELDQLLSGVSY